MHSKSKQQEFSLNWFDKKLILLIRGRVSGSVGLLPFLCAECNQHSKEGQETQVCVALASGRVPRTLADCCRHRLTENNWVWSIS